MIRVIFICERNKHYFEKIVRNSLKRNEYLIFDYNTDNAFYIHNRIVGYYNDILQGNIEIALIINTQGKPVINPFTKEQREQWLQKYYLNYEETYEESKKAEKYWNDFHYQMLKNEYEFCNKKRGLNMQKEKITIDKYFENEETGIWVEPEKKTVDIKSEITVEKPIDLRISNEISVPANQVTIENIKFCLRGYQITFKDSSNNTFNILFCCNDNGLIDYLNAAKLLKEPIYFEKTTKTFQIKDNIWKYYEKGASWYKN